MKIGIDLTWLKPEKSGGVEFYIRNLLDGFLELEDKNQYFLFTAKDNNSSLQNYKKDERITIIPCNTKASKVKTHLLWQNFCEYRILKKYQIDLCFFPVYEMPLYKQKKFKTVTTIHDIQAYHYPEYFSKLENLWFRIGWKSCIKNANKVITISDFTKQDIQKHFGNSKKIVRIYNPIVLNDETKVPFSELAQKYKIKRNEYYYTICSLHKHKNLNTLIEMIKEIQIKNVNIPHTLVISGVGGPQKNNIMQFVKSIGLENNIIFTNFVTNEERNTLIRNANAFLFPSLFEGFGMPPIEAMMLGARVITTKCTSLKEVTNNKCDYVKNPMDTQEWIKKIQKIQKAKKKKLVFPQYDKKTIARQYLDLFYQVIKEKNK